MSPDAVPAESAGEPAGGSSTLARWLALPYSLHFVLLGSLLFLLGRALGPGAGQAFFPAERRVVHLGAPRVLELEADFARAFGRRPNLAELQVLVDQEIDDQLLEFEARYLRLDFGDRSIEQRLLTKIRAIAPDLSRGDGELIAEAWRLGLDQDVVISRLLREKMQLYLSQNVDAVRPVSREELAAALERHRARFEQPGTIGFVQVFLSTELHGPAAATKAAALRERLLKAEPNAAAGAGDPFPLDSRFEGRTRAQVAQVFGAAFADAVLALPLAQWSPPIASPYGLHLVRVHSRGEPGLPTVDAVQQQLLALLEEERAARRIRQGIEELRRVYQIEVEWPPERQAELKKAGATPS